MIRTSALLVATLISLANCSAFKADPAPDAGFIEHPERLSTKAHEQTPFQRGWASQTWLKNRDNYKTVIVAPVDTTHLLKNSWWEQQTIEAKEEMEEDRLEIADYLRNQTIEAYQNDPHKRLRVVNTAESDTFILELALVELVPSKALLHALGSVGGLFVPGAGLLNSAGKGSVAIEGRLRDAKTKEILATFADREADKSAPLVNLAQYSWYQGSKQNIDDWAEQFVLLINRHLGETVEDSSPFTLRPW